MTLRDLYFFAFGIISATLLYAWIAGHTELTNAVRNNIRKLWARLTRNFGEKEEPEYKDYTFDHVKVTCKYTAHIDRNKDLFHN